MTSIARMVGDGIASEYIVSRSDKSKVAAKCSEKHGWKKEGKGCVRKQPKLKQEGGGGNKHISADVLVAASSVIKENRVAIATGAAAAAVGGMALSLPLIELDKTISPEREGGVRVPEGGLSPERLENYNKQFKKGDLVRNKFIAPTGTVGFHYGVYIGADKKSGEPQILHINPVIRGGKTVGTGVVVAGMKPAMNAGAKVFEYENAPAGEKRANVDIDQQIEKIRPYIGKTTDFNIFDKNCEAFARAVVGEEATSLQTAQMSKVGRTIGRNTYGRLFSFSISKGRPNEISFDSITKTLQSEIDKKKEKASVRVDSSTTVDASLDWSCYVETVDDESRVMSPQKALAIANNYIDPLGELKVAYLKGYFLFLAAAEYVISRGAKTS